MFYTHAKVAVIIDPQSWSLQKRIISR